LLSLTELSHNLLDYRLDLVAHSVGSIATDGYIVISSDHVGIGGGSHADGAVGATALLGHSLLVVAAAHGGEVVLGHGLGVVDH